MGDVIRITFSETQDSKSKEELRRRLEMARWKQEWREAEALGDFARMDVLHMQYEMVGLP